MWCFDVVKMVHNGSRINAGWVWWPKVISSSRNFQRTVSSNFPQKPNWRLCAVTCRHFSTYIGSNLFGRIETVNSASKVGSREFQDWWFSFSFCHHGAALFDSVKKSARLKFSPSADCSTAQLSAGEYLSSCWFQQAQTFQPARFIQLSFRLGNNWVNSI